MSSPHWVAFAAKLQTEGSVFMGRKQCVACCFQNHQVFYDHDSALITPLVSPAHVVAGTCDRTSEGKRKRQI